MEIYLLREQQQVGPYGSDDVRSWVSHGHVLPTELAWAPGMESWVPLKSILEDKSAAPEPAPAPIVAKPLPPATAQQKAFLSYMGASFTSDLTEDDAAVLCRHVTEDPRLAARLARWEEERLDLYPEMFKKELQARRENRPAYFHKMVQTEGGDCFTGVTKAHCQVLVGYLDINHPRWDANMRDASWHYFFPAIAEKFPQLVHKEWRPKLKFKDGPKVAAEILEDDANKDGRARRPMTFMRLLKMAAVVLLLLGAGGAVYGWRHAAAVPDFWKDRMATFDSKMKEIIRGDDPEPVKKAAAGKAPSEVEGLPSEKTGPAASTETKPSEGKPADVAMATPGETKPADPSMGTTEPKTPMASATDPKPTEPAMTGAKPDAPMTGEGMAPAAQPKPTDGLFNPNGVATVPAVVPPAPPSVGVVRTETHITQPTQIQMKYGIVTLNVGTALKVVSQEGNWLTINHMGQAYRVPVASTDYLR